MLLLNWVLVSGICCMKGCGGLLFFWVLVGLLFIVLMGWMLL